MELESVSFNVSKLCKSLIAGYRSKAAAQGIALTLNLAEDLPHTLYSDPTRIRQVISNLLSNAIKFTNVVSTHTQHTHRLHARAAHARALSLNNTLARLLTALLRCCPLRSLRAVVRVACTCT